MCSLIYVVHGKICLASRTYKQVWNRLWALPSSVLSQCYRRVHALLVRSVLAGQKRPLKPLIEGVWLEGRRRDVVVRRQFRARWELADLEAW
jgi:hypothetical protein